MAELTRQALSNPLIRQTAITLLRMMGTRDYTDFCRDVKQWVSQKTVLIGEADETLIPPWESIGMINSHGVFYGDCDDASMLVAALCRSVGLPARFRAVFRASDRSFMHVFAEADISLGGNQWLPLDSTIAGYPAWVGDSMVMEV